MMSKTRSAFLSLYAALTPALASAKCGNVDYSWGADALASAHDYAVTMMLNIVYMCYAVTGIVVIISALQIYIKMNTGEEGVKKNIMMQVPACQILKGATIVLRPFYGYQKTETGDTR